MKFTVERKALEKMLKQVGKRMPGTKRSDSVLRLSACSARVFVQANGVTAGIEALVFEDGTCTLDRKLLTQFVRTYKPKNNLTIEANAKFIEFGGSRLNVLGYSAKATPPGEFQVFPVTDTWVASQRERLI